MAGGAATRKKHPLAAMPLLRALALLSAHTPGAADPEDPGVITFARLALVVLLLALPLTVSAWMGLNLHWPLIIGGVRCVLQLLALGYVLQVIFEVNEWWVAALYIGFMLGVTTFEAVSRPRSLYTGISVHMMLAVGMPAIFALVYMLLVVIEPGPDGWFTAQSAIPLMGMMLGNTLNGVTVGVSTLLEQLQIERDALEWSLCMGASRTEAVGPLFARVLRTALMPLINGLSVVGLVSIPGMMTGQILAEEDPSMAARYQVMIMFSVAATTTAGCLLSTSLALLVLLDSQHRLRLDLLRKRDKRPALKWVRSQASLVAGMFKRREAAEAAPDGPGLSGAGRVEDVPADRRPLLGPGTPSETPRLK